MKENMDFRKYIQDHGISFEEFETMDDTKQKEIIKKFKIQNKGKNIQEFGEAMQGCGCVIMLFPILVILIIIIWTIIKS